MLVALVKHLEYLIRLLSENFSVATLSRGYKRKSEGFYWLMLLQMQKYLATNRFSFYEVQNIQVAVDADRKNGIQQLLSQTQKPEVIY
jgi:tetraacyldisaccharide 4'-kinase